MGLDALQYVGGKSGRTALGKWVADRIPYGYYYCEPFAGMLGVLLQRTRSPIEVVNDLNGHVTNWWEVVRDRTEELERWITLTPDSRRTFYASKAALETATDPVERAGLFSYVLPNSLFVRGDTYRNATRPDKPWFNLLSLIHI